MIVCVCEGVSDREIRGAIQHGADSVEAIGRACRAGTDCGACRRHLAGMLRERRAARTDAGPTAPVDGGLRGA
ncbi:MAG: (2Fe-2S)-binding protein [Deltaproteobacteria bacterium]|nr:MAG: (2Fe-2S)-binding protein [Deltaproteobacteria bacterium]